ncbi:RNA pseudouridine synthase 1 [Oryza brachyantha]|uniref:Pseudouridine synthase RsuA/RluA-like domain-containing protein n=1 Tax=Oryza brachyantha TaxID=4533 RepID=J3NE51_ORYBR|nr:RNA pseudouridine synthase 1 [Oryza brachyantha]
MTKLPLLLSPRAATALTTSPSLPPARRLAGAADADQALTMSAAEAGEYPVPVSPPYPAVSKDVELRRAMTASARSAAYSSATVVFEDEWLAVVDKPAGVYCDALLSVLPCPGSSAAASGDTSTKPNLHLANRLDRDTSGLMVITKCNKVAGKLVKAFTEHEVKKTYLALCIGCPPTWEKIKICSGHGRSKHGAWRVYAMSDVGRSLPGGSVVRDMSTQFEVLGINGNCQFREPSNLEVDEIESITVQEKAADLNSNSDVKNSSMILVRAYPRSGRTHQIRLHCQYLGIPIRGDVKYGGVIEWNGVDYDGHALHAESLSFVHPVTGLPVTFRSPLASWANEFISTME